MFESQAAAQPAAAGRRRVDNAAVGERQIRIRVAVCLLDGDRILLVEHQKQGQRYWLLPGGGVEVGETLAAAARREVAEETGLEVEVGSLLIVCESIEPGGRHLVNLVFAGSLAGGELAVGHDHRLVDAGWLPVDSLPSLTMVPAIGRELHRWCVAGADEAPVRLLGNLWHGEGSRPEDPITTTDL